MAKSSRARSPRVTGLGGVFFKSSDPAALGAWYRDHLDIPVESWGGAQFPWRDTKQPEVEGHTIWSPFAADTTYFKPSRKVFMLNFRVEDLDAVLAGLRSEGVKVIDSTEMSEFGKFGWVMDPEGNKVELWQPPAPTPAPKPKSKPKPKSNRATKTKSA